MGTQISQTAADLEMLQALNRDYINSVQAGDVRRFNELLAQDYYCSNPDGSLVDRNGFLEQTAKPVSIANLRVGGGCATGAAPSSELQMMLAHAAFVPAFLGNWIRSSCKALSGPTGLDMLAVRIWVCSACGDTHDRDVNAARNILSAGRSPPSVSGNEQSLAVAEPSLTYGRCEAKISGLKAAA